MSDQDMLENEEDIFKTGPFPLSNWEWQIAKDEHGVTFHVANAPCWLHRIAQRVILGIIWTRSKEAGV